MDVENANCKLKLSQCTDIEVLPIEKPLKIDIEITGLDALIAELHRVFSYDHVNVQDVQKLMAGYKSNPKDWKKYAKFDRFRYTRNLVDAGNGAFNIMILCWGGGHASAIHDHADSHCFMKLLSGSLEEVRYAWPENVEPEVVKKLKNNNIRNTCCSDDEEGTLDEKIEDINRNYKNDENRLKKCNCGNEDCISGECGKDLYNNGGDQNGEYKYKGGDNKESKNDNEETVYAYKDVKEIRRTRLNVNDVCYINDALGLHRMENPSHVDGAVSLHLYCPPFDSCRVFDARTGKPTEVKVTFWSMYGKKIKRVIEGTEIADSQ